MEQDDASGLLGSFALGNVLGGLGLGDQEDLEGLERMGLMQGGKKRGAGLQENDIYNEKYDDDLEAGLDEEFAEEDRKAAEEEAALQQQQQQGPSTGQRLRGEDDYDFDEEEEEGQQQEQPEGEVKAEEGSDEDGDLFEGDDSPYLSPSEEEARKQEQEQQQQNYVASQIPDLAMIQEALALPGDSEADLVRSYYPSFSQGATLNFTDLLAQPSSRDKKRKKPVRGPVQIALPPPTELSEAPSTREPKQNAALQQQHLAASRLAVLSDLVGDLLPKPPVSDDAAGLDADVAYQALVMDNALREAGWHLPHLDQVHANPNVDLEPWEDRVVWSHGKENQHHRGSEQQPAQSVSAQRQNPKQASLPYTNQELMRGDWTKAIIWDDHTPHQSFARLEIYDNDPNLIRSKLSAAEDEEMQHQQGGTHPAKKRRLPLAHLGQQLDVYNLSNDRVYESLKEKKKVVRQTFGNLEVQHAWPALKLQLPYYRTSLTKSEARSYHRPTIQFPVGVPMTFSKVRSAKKKGRENKPTGAAAGPALGPSRQRKNDNPIRNTAELSLKDTSPYVLTEFSEEYPPIMSNMGMGSIIVNYYRKLHPKDEHIPKMDLGEAFVLDDKDETPFNRFGSVKPGEVVPTLYNNLVRAPIFKHKPPQRDFLVVKTTVGNTTSYYIRDIKNLFVIGQSYPQTEVPGPHSRKVTNMLKLRLQAIAARLCDHNDNHRVKIHKLIRYFPDSTELQMRQKLKDFMEYVRRGPNQGFWMMKQESKGFEEVMRDVKPEDVVLSEAMLVGQRHLLDAGYGKGGEEIDMAEEDESKMDIEQQLAPWITTKNFLNATQNKAMLKLHGEGDPTGRGEGFNFVRVSMKDIFLREGETMADRDAEMLAKPRSSHKYNVAEQQEIYKEEIERIWRLQQSTLSNPRPPQLTQEDETRFEQQAAEKSQFGPTPGVPGAPAIPADGFSGAVSPSSSAAQKQQSEKVLRISRTERSGHVTTEVVRDPAVIGAYIQQRQLLEEENMKTEELAPTEDAQRNDRMKKRLQDLIANMKHNQDRRMQRKSAKPGTVGPDGKVSGGGGGSRNKGSKAETTRKCGNCGAVGHMKTNRNCPRYLDFYTEDGKKRPNAGQQGGTPGPSAGSPAAGSAAGTPAPSAFSPAAGEPSPAQPTPQA